jgi:small subunit ribosomal protein S6e
MPTFKLVLSDPISGKARQFEIKDPLAQRFVGLKIGDEIDGIVLKDFIELPKGAKIKITGGSGIEGAPMHPGVPGPVKRYILADPDPPGTTPRRRGCGKKKLVRGNTISDSIVQINAVVVYPKGYAGPPVHPIGS